MPKQKKSFTRSLGVYLPAISHGFLVLTTVVTKANIDNESSDLVKCHGLADLASGRRDFIELSCSRPNDVIKTRGAALWAFE